ncbi:hypothetical protein HDV05_000341 [Chytridiales sp. JEL 0842]|nr:hypothetical protein HDV05_000341 [Chytridiales sp. JEL 0842]
MKMDMKPSPDTSAAPTSPTTTASKNDDPHQSDQTRTVDFSTWSKDELISHIKSLQQQQQEQQQQAQSIHNNTPTKSSRKQNKPQRPFDFSKHSARPIALKIAYLGWNYHGLASQESDSVPTIESHLFDALLKARLIPSRTECRWSRCGRTDKGVSSFGQVVGCFVRSALGVGAKGTVMWEDINRVRREGGVGKRKRKGVDADEDNPNAGDDDDCMVDGMDVDADKLDATATTKDFGIIFDEAADVKELSYVTILNRLLPPDIRVLAWCPVPFNFDARFDCTFRRYRYFFPSEGLNLQAMQEAASKFVGVKDFRFFCKVDPTKNVKTYERRILSASVTPLKALQQPLFSTTTTTTTNPPTTEGPEDFLVFEVKGHAFLWHQVRCMMAILHLIGRNLESPSLIDSLTDIFKHPDGAGRPIYAMASEIPLVLVECGFPPGLLNWKVGTSPETGEKEMQGLVTDLWTVWRDLEIRATQVRSLLEAFTETESFTRILAAPEPVGVAPYALSELFGMGKEGVWAVATEEGKNRGGKGYIPVMERKRCDSIEQRMAKVGASKAAKKQKKQKD